ncbi:MAG: TetR/AcrR family transcriptional regulator, partial [Leptospira sp.]|nr:TetR/AcrR family transcriptional regulator [Leptospira sp.]
YAQTQSDAYNSNVENCAKTNDLKSRVRFIVEYKIDQFVPHRKFVHILAKSAGDPKNSLSPFSHETNRIREEAILLFRNALENSNTSIHEDLLPVMPKLFWLYQLGILFYWTYDESARQKNTKILIDYSLSIIFYLIRFSRLPIFRPVRKSILNVLNELGFGHGKNQDH